MSENITELRKEVLDYFKSRRIIGRTYYSLPIQKLIHFNKKGLKHLVSRNYNQPNIELNLAKNLPKILSDSFYMGFTPNTKSNKDVLGVHNYYSIGIYQGKIYQVWIKVKETKGLVFMYDFGIIKEL